MIDDTTAALQEIAALLRRRVDQHDEMARVANERISKFTTARGNIPDIAAMRAQHETQMARAHEVAEQRYAEEQAFRKQLLEGLERHNVLLERILSRLEG